MAEVARLRVIPSRDGLPGEECWLFIRKYPDGERKYALSNALKSISFRKLTRAATLRWPIEQCFQEGKEQLGMDHYEHRSWPGWHRHMLFVFLAQLFLLQLRDGFKKSPTLTLPQAQLLVAAVLEEGRITKSRALQIVQYYTKRNYVAWKAHGKTRLRELRKQRRRLRR